MKAFLLALTFSLVGCSSSKEVTKNLLRGPASVNNEFEQLKDDLVFSSSDCQIVAANMVTGKVTAKKASQLTSVCLKDGFDFHCEYIEDGKTFASRSMVGGSSGQEGIISTNNNSDSFYLNLVTRKFYSTANIYFEHGSVRGQKICSGDFFYGKDIKKSSK